MSEPASANEPPIPSLELNPPPKEDALALVQERLSRLEHEVVQLRDTAALEERVLRRVREETLAHNGVWGDKIRAGPPPTPPPPSTPGSTATVERVAAATSSGWLVLDSIRELRLVFRMFFDRRFRLSMSTWIIVILFLPAILLSKWWFPPSWLFFVGDYLDKILNVILAWVVYKALSREVRRYQAMLQERT